MKIYILGPSASGKTTLAKKIARKEDILIFHSDFVLTEYNGRDRRKRTREEYMKKVKEILAKDKWIFEGKHIIKKLLEAADKIIWLKPSLFVTLFQQWKRYFTDKNQRERFTFINNLQLSSIIIHHYLGREDLSSKSDPRYAHQKKYKRILRKYRDKVIEIKSNNDIENLVE